ncbi:hypothetical protein BP1258A_1578 [Burkholderia pseudomallei 1258a]|uniref:Uncharacterized protein n=1 Tax=Burkholderia pseudomallei (strain 1026b) TaxID=884204 RepID=A0A0H3HNN1_BURP2|nr:hypothetical protein BP1026B_I1901 [Burkholderia pseudomallei 1026b]EIF64900.1 hypothetical protein BP1258A_1578 [Burkholderia pseudomallei 1258a]EIF65921.1 hypothetical protein BP1026A_1035 [Burkholderia pseudomallei 1026a]EIF67498.1 hypothetical protein BP1258B_1671 [Burkholderia pseudomallei 1258b]EIF76598.1 hypothetical protein BP354E_1455 [Burkholderia pseudomallei 354e]EIF80966.1 hypothetical protein BP354A_1833 [Burkholderia pseudomallei 354a]KOT21141.1 hypothetical protein DM47_359
MPSRPPPHSRTAELTHQTDTPRKRKGPESYVR